MSNETKFTPGPWHWHPYGGYHFLCNDTKTAEGDFPGSIIHSDGSACGKYCPDINVTGPDAALIAAAPDLYAAAKEAQYWLERAWGRCDKEGDCSCPWCGIEKALAKARGEA